MKSPISGLYLVKIGKMADLALSVWALGSEGAPSLKCKAVQLDTL